MPDVVLLFTSRQHELVTRGLIDLARKHPKLDDEIEPMLDDFKFVEPAVPTGGPWVRYDREIRGEDVLEIKGPYGFYYLATFCDDVRLVDLAIEMMELGVQLRIVRHGVVVLTVEDVK